jgi:hypothetical protein
MNITEVAVTMANGDGNYDGGEDGTSDDGDDDGGKSGGGGTAMMRPRKNVVEMATEVLQ